jgi:serine/threonine protein kinase/TolB-like protein/Tfp pilus assembly protein PilF
MDKDQRLQADRCFSQALERPAAERGRFLEECCAGDASLRAAVEQLLTAAESDDAFLSPGGALQGGIWQSLTASPATVPPPERIGAYRIVREIGRGGMSVVYLGERDDGAFDQRAALKLIKPGADSEEVLRRFEQERQILASLSHPAIARLFDGGSTESGRPYFVMEFVAGQPIDAYCRDHDCTIEERLELCISVCAAVQHAHASNVVHRDLKPSNILVSDDGHVKLLDFGIAKALDPETLPNAAPATKLALRPLTPEYASPEQVRGDPVTEASDVYQLGVLLYLLLTDRMPYRLEGESTESLARAICEQTPLPPSTQVTQRAESRPQALPPDATAPGLRRLGRRLRGDLDTIVLMSLRKEPQRRYADAAALAADLRRYLAGQPVEARRDSLVYRVRKRLRRHVAMVLAAASAAVAATILVVGMPGAPGGGVEAVPGTLAVLPFANLSGMKSDEYFCDGIAEELINRLAEGGLPVVARTSSFAFRNESRPLPEIARTLNASYLLEGSLRRDGERVRVIATLIDASGRQLWSERFDRELAGIFAVQDDIVSAVVANVAPALQLARAPHLSPTDNLEAYQRYLRGKDLERRRPSGWLLEALEAYRQAIDLDPQFAAAWAGFAVATRLSVQWAPEPQVEIERAQRAVARALEIDPDLPEAHAAQGLQYSMELRETGAAEAAETALRRAIELNPRLVSAHNWLAIVLQHQQRFDEADEILHAALAVDPVNPLLILNIARGDVRRGRYAAAKRAMVSVLRLPNPPAWSHSWIAELEAAYGRFDEALAWINRGAEELPEPQRYWTMAEGADYYARLGLFPEARRVIERAESGLRESLDPQYMKLVFREGHYAQLEQNMLQELADRQIDTDRAPAWLRQYLAFAHVLNGSYDSGIAILESILDGDFNAQGTDQVEDGEAAQYLAWAYRKTDREKEAIKVLTAMRDAIESRRASGWAQSPSSIFVLARTQAMLGETAAALELLDEAFEAGWRDYYATREDPRWESLHGTPEFEALMVRTLTELEPQRERARAERPLLLASTGRELP